MQLILWRHAEAEDDAVHMSAWLHSQLRDEIIDWRIVASPAKRAQQTAQTLGLPIETVNEIAPDATPAAIIEAARWPHNPRNVIVVGHQPTLGMVAAKLINGVEGYISIKKGAMWWFEISEINLRDGRSQIRLKAMATPDTVL
jgi:phosphohistidine phosphatase